MLIEGPAQCLMLADWPGLINSAVWSEEEEEKEEERGGERRRMKMRTRRRALAR